MAARHLRRDGNVRSAGAVSGRAGRASRRGGGAARRGARAGGPGGRRRRRTHCEARRVSPRAIGKERRLIPVRSCVGCRERFEQERLFRFVRTSSGWRAGAPGGRRKQPGRGVYLCGEPCAQRARKNKRYPGLGAAAAEYALIKSL
ncbi:MAG: DUF448 domain-containing protein [Candidatus Eremiobacteraeota bacterium]|nr:DUF448 domain-containing protein [Candidatus Eremiobacteraeota bacterium]